MQEIKSLQTKLSITTSGTDRLPLLIQLSGKLLQVHIENALSCAKEAQAIAEKLGDNDALAEAYRLQAMISHLKTDLKIAKPLIEKAIALSETSTNQKVYASALCSQGVIYLAIPKIGNAIKIFEKSLAIFNQLKSDIDVARVFSNMSIAYKLTTEYEKSLHCLDEAEVIYKELNDKSGLQNCKANQAVIYFHLNRFEESLQIFTDCMHYYEAEHNRHFYGNTLWSIANCHNRMENYTNCLKYLQLAIKEFTSLGHKLTLPGLYNDIGDTFMKLEGYAEAEKYFKKSMRILEEENSFGETYSFACFAMGNCALQIKDYNIAEAYLLKSLALGEEKELAMLIPRAQTKLAELYILTGQIDKARQYVSSELIV